MTPLRILIFAKAPVPGLAKTRLAPILGAEGAARLAGRMLMHTIYAALRAHIGDVELCVTPSPREQVWRAMSLPDRIRIVDQGGGDLGARMARAARRTLRAGRSALLIGTDCPALTATRLRKAAAGLRRADALIWPTVDGGYALLGLHRYSPRLFSNIAWGSASVASETQKRLLLLGWRMEIRPPLTDIDRPADLRYVPPGWRVESARPEAKRRRG